MFGGVVCILLYFPEKGTHQSEIQPQNSRVSFPAGSSMFVHRMSGQNKKALLLSDPLQPSGNHRHGRKLLCSCAGCLTLKLLVCFTRVAQVQHGNFAQCRRLPNIYKLQCKIGLDKLQCSADPSDPKMFVSSGHHESIFGK